MQDEKLKQFSLVGGTALALYMGHRKSVDLDLFSRKAFDVHDLEKHLNQTYNFLKYKESDATLIGFINDVKLDFIRYDYPLIKPLCLQDEIRLYSMPDISAMKLVAISQNGTRLKDYVDVAYLSTEMSLKEMLDAFEMKYPKTHKILALKGLSYFADIDFSAQIELTSGHYKWKEVEKRLKEMVKYPTRVFPQFPDNIDSGRKSGIRR
jgi:predicted nucleotidyltransferase component of viral defense system